MLALTLIVGPGCSKNDAATGAGGTSGAGGGGGTGVDAATDGSSDGVGGAAAALPPSCAPGGPGLTTCGSTSENCCTSPLVTGGTYARTYSISDAGASDGGSLTGTDPATISDFRLDKYAVTVGRFRQFVNAARAADGGVGWRPAAGAGKHTHLNGGMGLLDIGQADAGVVYEPGWSAADDDKVAPTDANLTSCGPASTWTPTAGTQETRPINCVTWQEAAAFCIWDGAFLPSEAEWEYAAAGGSQQRAYPWGATAPGTTSQYAIYDCNYPTVGNACSDVSSIAPVGAAKAGEGRYGQLDLAGNMWQWSADWYGTYVSPCTDCAKVSAGSSRVLRGGGFREAASNILPTYRNANDPTLRNDFGGLRCARKP
jgi:formylglycine-generating enzyme